MDPNQLPKKLIIAIQSLRQSWTCVDTFFFDFEQGVIFCHETTRGLPPYDVFGLSLNFGASRDRRQNDAAQIKAWVIRAGLAEKDEDYNTSWDAEAVTNGRTEETKFITRYGAYLSYLPDGAKDSDIPEEDRFFEIPKGTPMRFTPLPVNYWTREIDEVAVINSPLPDGMQAVIDLFRDTSSATQIAIYNSAGRGVSPRRVEYCYGKLQDIEEAKRIVSKVWHDLSLSQLVFRRQDPRLRFQKDKKDCITSTKAFLKQLDDWFFEYDLPKDVKPLIAKQKQFLKMLTTKRFRKKNSNRSSSEVKKALARHVRTHAKTHKIVKLLAYAQSFIGKMNKPHKKR